MNGNRNFGEGSFFTIVNYVWWFFLGNLYFFLLNIPLLLFIFYTLFTPDMGKEIFTTGYIFYLFIACIPVGPALTALDGVMGKIIREKDVNFTREYFKAYKNSFKQSISVWILQLVFTYIFIIDIRFFTQTSFRIIGYAFIGVLSLLLITSLYVYPIISRFYMKTRDVLRLSLYYAIKRIKTTLLVLSAFVCVGVLFKLIASVTVLFDVSILCYLTMFYEKDILKEVQDKLKLIE